MMMEDMDEEGDMDADKAGEDDNEVDEGKENEEYK